MFRKYWEIYLGGCNTATRGTTLRNGKIEYKLDLPTLTHLADGGRWWIRIELDNYPPDTQYVYMDKMFQENVIQPDAIIDKDNNYQRRMWRALSDGINDIDLSVLQIYLEDEYGNSISVEEDLGCIITLKYAETP